MTYIYDYIRLSYINKERIEMTTIYMAVRYPKNWTKEKKIKEISLEDHLKKYNSVCDNIGDGLQLFLNKEEAEKHLIKVNK